MEETTIGANDSAGSEGRFFMKLTDYLCGQGAVGKLHHVPPGKTLFLKPNVPHQMTVGLKRKFFPCVISRRIVNNDHPLTPSPGMFLQQQAIILLLHLLR
jgi:hypothetical protein